MKNRTKIFGKEDSKMVYRGTLQTDDPRDAPKLVRMAPLRSSGPKTSSRQIPGVVPRSVQTLNPISSSDSLKKTDDKYNRSGVSRSNGAKIEVPRLRNINQIRETVFIDRSLTPIEMIGRNDRGINKSRPYSIALNPGGEEVARNLRNNSRPQSTMLANLRDLERLRNTPPSRRSSQQQNLKIRRSVDPDDVKLLSTMASKDLRNVATPGEARRDAMKIHSDIARIQRMFECAATAANSANAELSRRNNTAQNSRAELSRVQNLLPQRSYEQTRQSQELQKPNREKQERQLSNNNSNKPPKYASKSQQASESLTKKLAAVKSTNKPELPSAPARKRRDGKLENILRNEKYHQDEKNPEKTRHQTDYPSQTKRLQSNQLQRPDILEGLVKESDQQIADLKIDMQTTRRSRPRSVWRGMVQSMRLHDVELHSDNEDQHKGKKFSPPSPKKIHHKVVSISLILFIYLCQIRISYKTAVRKENLTTYSYLFFNFVLELSNLGQNYVYASVSLYVTYSMHRTPGFRVPEGCHGSPPLIFTLKTASTPDPMSLSYTMGQVRVSDPNICGCTWVCLAS